MSRHRRVCCQARRPSPASATRARPTIVARPARDGRRREPLVDAERQRDRHPGQRDVRVAVGETLRADLQQAQDRHQRAEEPQPADHDVAAARGQRAGRQRHEQGQRAADLEPRPRPAAVQVGVRVERRELARPDALREVAHVRDRRVGGARPRAELLGQHDRVVAPLVHDRRRGDGGREEQEGQLLEQAPCELPAQPREGPAVEQQPHERQRDEHRLGHQAQGVQQQRPPRSAVCRRAGPTRSRPTSRRTRRRC